MSDIDHYRNPGGWVEFWLGLVVFTLFFSYMFYIQHQHSKVEEADSKYQLEYTQPKKNQ